MNLFIKDFPDDLHRALKIEAAMKGKTLGDVAAEIIEKWAKKQEQPKIRKPSRDGLV